MSKEAAGSQDVITQAMWRAVKAKLLARRGELAQAENLALEAVRLASSTDVLNDHAKARMALAEVLTLAGRREEAAAAVQEALGLHEAKGNIVSARKARAALEELRGSRPPCPALPPSPKRLSTDRVDFN